MRKILVCVLILQFKGSCFFQLQIFTTTYIVFGFNRWFSRWAGIWGKLTPMKWAVFMNFTQRQKLVCNSQKSLPPNILHLLCIWVKWVGVWGKITPMKWAVFIKLYPMSKARMSLSKILPQTSKKFTQIYLPYLWHYATLLEPMWGRRARSWRATTTNSNWANMTLFAHSSRAISGSL